MGFFWEGKKLVRTMKLTNRQKYQGIKKNVFVLVQHWVAEQNKDFSPLCATDIKHIKK